MIVSIIKAPTKISEEVYQSGQESRQIAKSGQQLKDDYTQNRSDYIDQVLS